MDEAVVADLEAIMGEPGSVLTNLSSRTNRTRVPAPFPVHRWGEYVPAAVVLPRTAQQVSEILKLANRAGIPVVPRAGGTGLNDGAVPLRGGIIVDIKRMNQIKEIDLIDRSRHRRSRYQHDEAQRSVEANTTSSIPIPRLPTPVRSSADGSARSGFSLLGTRFGHSRDLVDLASR